MKICPGRVMLRALNDYEIFARYVIKYLLHSEEAALPQSVSNKKKEMVTTVIVQVANGPYSSRTEKNVDNARRNRWKRRTSCLVDDAVSTV